MTEATNRPGPRGPRPLSDSTRRRLLAGLMAKADAGDVAAAESLVRLSLTTKGQDDSPARRGARRPE